MPLFDAYLFVDWSSAAKMGPRLPQKDQIWIGECVRCALYDRHETYCRTRDEAIEYLIAGIQTHSDAARRVLIGFDFTYGYPAGFGDALRLPEGLPRWRAVWGDISRQLTDDADNRNTRLEVAGLLDEVVRATGSPGPFWGRPTKCLSRGLPRTSPAYPAPTARGQRLQKFRHVERRVGRGMLSPWQMFYTGSVGGHALTGIPRVLALRYHPEFAAISRVWSFETGFTNTPSATIGPSIVHTETWPSIGNERVLALQTTHPKLIRDQAQVQAQCH